MAIRVRAQLRKWFGRGMYPTAEQFSDLFDSFFHKTEDKIPMSGVEGLTDQLNGKYSTAEGRELEKKVQKVTTDLSAHVASSEKAFNEVQNDIEALDGRLDDEIERAKDEEAAIRRELAAGDAATLSSAKSYTDTSVAAEAGKREQGDATTLQAAKNYTDTSVAAEAEERTQGDATTLSSAKTYTDTSVADEAQKRGQGDAATLQSANSHADAAVASEKSARESGDRTTLELAKAYVDKAIAELVDGSPAALDTLKELSAALGNDPNFATTVATQIGQKVDKVAGKGLSTEDYTSEEKAKLAGVAAGANNYQHPATHPATMIEQDASHRFVTDAEKTTWNGKASTAVVTQSANGLMSAADKKKLDGITDDILSLPGEGYEEVEIVDQVSMSASGVMVKVVPGFVLFIIKSVQFGGLKTAKFTLPGFIIGSVLTPAAFRAPGGTCTTIYISTSTDKTNKCSNIMFSGVDNAGEVTAPLTFAIQATSFSRE
ncbi:hypothetical protein [Alistipes communis]|uniref:hypothetical protein n=2 Tax=Alistipes TaxID=239759 RepID=UPI003AF82655